MNLFAVFPVASLRDTQTREIYVDNDIARLPYDFLSFASHSNRYYYCCCCRYLLEFSCEPKHYTIRLSHNFLLTTLVLDVSCFLPPKPSPSSFTHPPPPRLFLPTRRNVAKGHMRVPPDSVLNLCVVLALISANDVVRAPLSVRNGPLSKLKRKKDTH